MRALAGMVSLAHASAESYRLAFPDVGVKMCMHYAWCCKPDDVAARHWLVLVGDALAEIDEQQEAIVEAVETGALAEMEVATRPEFYFPTPLVRSVI